MQVLHRERLNGSLYPIKFSLFIAIPCSGINDNRNNDMVYSQILARGFSLHILLSHYLQALK